MADVHGEENEKFKDQKKAIVRFYSVFSMCFWARIDISPSQLRRPSNSRASLMFPATSESARL